MSEVIKPLEMNEHPTTTNSKFDELVKAVFGRPYCIQQQDGCRPRGELFVTPHTEPEDPECGYPSSIVERVNGDDYGVNFEAWLARSPKAALKDQAVTESWSIATFYERNFYPPLDRLAGELAKMGFAPSTPYYISIDW